MRHASRERVLAVGATALLLAGVMAAAVRSGDADSSVLADAERLIRAECNLPGARAIRHIRSFPGDGGRTEHVFSAAGDHAGTAYERDGSLEAVICAGNDRPCARHEDGAGRIAPDVLAQGLYRAWSLGVRAMALDCATAPVVDALFSVPWREATFRAPCDDQGLTPGVTEPLRALDCVFEGEAVELHLYQECTAALACTIVRADVIQRMDSGGA